MSSGMIQWPKASWWTDAWNPVIGCRKVSPACDNCWACAWAKRFKQSFEPHDTPKPPPRKGVVFCGSLTDLFGEWRDLHDMGENIATCVAHKGATYMWLTKRTKQMVDALHYVSDRLSHPVSWFENHYFGFTAESQGWYDKRLEYMIDAFPKWANGFISAEPLLGYVNLGLDDPTIREMIDWVVVGAESGRNRRSCNIKWVEHVVYQCCTFNIPVFVKQLDINGRCETDINKFPEHLRIRQVPWETRK